MDWASRSGVRDLRPAIAWSSWWDGSWGFGFKYRLSLGCQWVNEPSPALRPASTIVDPSLRAIQLGEDPYNPTRGSGRLVVAHPRVTARRLEATDVIRAHLPKAQSGLTGKVRAEGACRNPRLWIGPSAKWSPTPDRLSGSERPTNADGNKEAGRWESECCCQAMRDVGSAARTDDSG